MDLRDFRNDIVHGNFSDEHRIYALYESGYDFYYSPSADFRGTKTERKSPEILTRYQSQFGSGAVKHVKRIVDDLRQAILSAMDEPTRAWVESWLWDAVVPPPNAP